MSYTIPPPSEWQTFEKKIKELFKLSLNDPTGLLNGRSGQNQNGVDFYAYRNQDVDQLVGVQCKQKTWNKAVKKSELREEVKKATKFKPPLKEYIFVTTAPDDVEIQKEARIVTKELATSETPFIVVVWGWDTLQDEINKFESEGMVKLWYPGFEKNIIEIKKNAQLNTKSLLDPKQISSFVEHAVSAALEGQNQSASEKIDQIHHNEIDTYRDLIQEGKHEIALDLLLKKSHVLEKDISDRVKFRVNCNIGACYYNLGQFSEAIKYFEFAYKFDQNDPISNSNFVLAAHLKKDKQLCWDRAIKALELNNDDKTSAVHLVYSSQNLRSLDDAFEKLPEDLRTEPEIIAAKVDKLRELTSSDWASISKGLENHESLILQRVWADYVIEQYVSLQGNATGFRSTVTIDELTKAKDIYQTLWNEMVDKNLMFLSDAYSNNLAILLLAVDLDEEASEVLKTALKVHPNEPNLSYLYAVTLAKSGKEQEASEVLEQVRLTPEIALLMAELYAETSPKKSQEVIEKLNWDQETPELKLRAKIHSITATINLKKPHDHVVEEVDQLINDFPDRATPLCLKAQIELLEKNEVSKITIDKLDSISSSLTDFSDIVGCAEIFSKTNSHKKAFELVWPHIDFSINSSLIQLVLNICYDSNDAELYTKLSKKLDERIIGKRSFNIFKLNMGYITSDLIEVSEALETLMESDKGNVRYCVQYVDALRRLGKDGETKSFLENFEFNFQGEVSDNIEFIKCFERFVSKEKAFAYLYQYILDFPNDKTLYNFAAQFLMAKTVVPQEWLDLDTVSTNSYVEVTATSGEKQYFIVEEIEHLQRYSLHLPASNNFVKLFIGLKLDDKITDNHGEQWQITHIQHKYLYKLHEIINGLQVHSGDNPPIQRLKIDPQNPDFSEIFAETQKRRNQSDIIRSNYSENTIPLRLAAHWSGVSPMEFYESTLADSINIKSSSGNLNNLNKAVQSIEFAKNKGCAVDALTLHVLYRLDLLEDVERFFGKIYVSQSVMDHFLSRYEHSITFEGGPGGTLSYDPISGQNIWTEVTEEQIQKHILELENELSVVRSFCTVQKISLNKPRLNIKEHEDALTEEFWDDALVAKQTETLLVSEDWAYRKIVDAELNIESVWIQALLVALEKSNCIDFQTYCNSLTFLSYNKHHFTSVTAEVIFSVWKNNPDELEIILRNIFTEDAEPYSHLKVAVRFILMIWRRDNNSLQVQNATGTLLRHLMYSDFINIAELIKLFLRHPEHIHANLRHYLINWSKGHFVSLN